MKSTIQSLIFLTPIVALAYPTTPISSDSTLLSKRAPTPWGRPNLQSPFTAKVEPSGGDDKSCDAEPACPEGQTGQLADDGSCQCTTTTEGEQQPTEPTKTGAPPAPKKVRRSLGSLEKRGCWYCFHLHWAEAVPNPADTHIPDGDNNDHSPTPEEEKNICDATWVCPQGQTGKLADDGTCQCNATDKAAPTYEQPSESQEPESTATPKAKRSAGSMRHENRQ